MVANLADLVGDAAASRPRHPAVVTDSRVTTWSEVEWQVRAVASGLIARGLEPGSRVAILQRNTLEFVTSYFGILRAGMCAVPLNVGYTAAELTLMLSDVDAKLVLADPETESQLRQIPDTDVIYTGTEDWRRFTVGSSPLPTDPTDPESIAVLLFTSGTSGRPKAAMLTHRALLANLDQLGALEQPPALTAEDIVLCVLPLFHIYALNATLGLVARQHATVVLLDRFDPAAALAAIGKHHVTNVAGAPPMYVAWSIQEGLAEILDEVRLLVSGAAALPRNIMEQFETVAGKPIWEGYGMTECSPVITASLVAGRPKPGFVGQPLPGVEIELRDPDGVVREGDPGEIFVRGANVFSGYWPEGSGGPDDDGWFATGDVAYADEQGDLRLVDRRRDLIIVSGFNVYPREVEDALLDLEGVIEVAVMGVTHPYTGEAVKAFVVVEPGSEITSEDVLAFARTRLARFKCPTIVELVGDLPHSITGKVSKGRLRESQGVVSL